MSIDSEKTLLAKANMEATARLLKVRAKPGKLFLADKRGQVSWSCGFGDNTIRFFAENTALKRLPIGFFASFKEKCGLTTLMSQVMDPELSQIFDLPFYCRDPFLEKTKAFILKNASFRSICSSIDFNAIQNLYFTDYQFFANATFTTAEACEELIHTGEMIMTMLYQERLPEIEKVLASKGLNVRRQLAKLNVKDLETYPAWEFASDEEGVAGQDETTVRPYLDGDVTRGEGCYLLSTTFHLANGTVAKGFIISVDDLANFNLMQPTVILGKKQSCLVLGKSQTIEEKLSPWKLKFEAIFPLRFSTDVTYDGKILTGTVDRFMTEADWRRYIKTTQNI